MMKENCFRTYIGLTLVNKGLYVFSPTHHKPNTWHFLLR